VKILISRRAEDDLAGLYTWVAVRHGEQAAELFRERVEEALALLREHPQAGSHPSWATGHEHLRYWIISRTPCVIYYEYRPDEISIERVLHGRRDVRRIVESGLQEPAGE
jgi:plasmid stabilization system protein ParE